MDEIKDIKEIVDSYADWVDEATETALSEGADGIRRCIDNLVDDQLRSMVFVLLVARCGDAERLRDLTRDAIAREQFDRMGNRGSATLH